jgi:hypothetical protein
MNLEMFLGVRPLPAALLDSPFLEIVLVPHSFFRGFALLLTLLVDRPLVFR